MLSLSQIRLDSSYGDARARRSLLSAEIDQECFSVNSRRGVIREYPARQYIRGHPRHNIMGPSAQDPALVQMPAGCQTLVCYIQPDLRLYIIDRVVLDDGDSEFERECGIVRQFAPDPGVERQKQPAGLARDRISEIDANVRARIKGYEPSVGKAEVEGRCYLQVAYIFFGRIAGETDVVSNHR